MRRTRRGQRNKLRAESDLTLYPVGTDLLNAEPLNPVPSRPCAEVAGPGEDIPARRLQDRRCWVSVDKESVVAEDEVEISIPGHAFRCWVDYAPRHEHPLDIKKPSENLGGNYPSLGVFDAVEHIWMVPDSVVDRRRKHKAFGLKPVFERSGQLHP